MTVVRESRAINFVFANRMQFATIRLPAGNLAAIATQQPIAELPWTKTAFNIRRLN